MSIWKEIKKSINSDLDLPLNEQLVFNDITNYSVENRIFDFNMNSITVKGSDDKANVIDSVKFLRDGLIHLKIIYNTTHTSSSNYYTGEVRVYINKKLYYVKTISALPISNNKPGRFYVQNINIKKGDILDIEAVGYTSPGQPDRGITVKYVGLVGKWQETDNLFERL